MKKTVLLTTFCLWAIVGTAQNSKIEWGITTGLNMSKIENYEWQRTDVPLEKPTWLAGGQVDLLVRYRLSAHWAVGANVQWVQKGWKGQLDKWGLIDNVGMTQQQVLEFYTQFYTLLSTPKPNRLGYVSIPIVAEYRFWDERLHVQLGGYWASLAASPWFPLEKTFDWGAKIGVGVRQPILEKGFICLDVIYSHGFRDIYNTVGSFNRLPELATGNRTFGANLGLVFGL